MGVGRGEFPPEVGYIGEIAWLSQHGIISDYWQYMALPLTVLEDCRLVMTAQAMMGDPQRGGQPTQDLMAKER